MMTLQAGSKFLVTSVENIPDYQYETESTKNREIKYEALGELFAYLMINNSYQTKRGTIYKGCLHEQQSKGICNYS